MNTPETTLIINYISEYIGFLAIPIVALYSFFKADKKRFLSILAVMSNYIFTFLLYKFNEEYKKDKKIINMMAYLYGDELREALATPLPVAPTVEEKNTTIQIKEIDNIEILKKHLYDINTQGLSCIYVDIIPINKKRYCYNIEEVTLRAKPVWIGLKQQGYDLLPNTQVNDYQRLVSQGVQTVIAYRIKPQNKNNIALLEVGLNMRQPSPANLINRQVKEVVDKLLLRLESSD